MTDTEPGATGLSCKGDQVVINVMGTSSHDSFQACNDIAIQSNLATGNLLVLIKNEARKIISNELLEIADRVYLDYVGRVVPQNNLVGFCRVR